MKFNETQNHRITENLQNDLILNPITDEIPKIVNPTIQPVYEVYRRWSNIVVSASSAVSGAGNILTVPNDRDTFLTALSFAIAKDATCDLASSGTALSVTVTVNGTGRTLAAIPTITLTAQTAQIHLIFPTPVKVDRNTTIALATATFTAGALFRTVTLYGYTNTPSQPQYQF